jgi:excinuclease ABC subunit C
LFEAALALLLAENEDFHPLVLTNLEVRTEAATALTATEAVPEAYRRGPEAEVGEAPDHELNPEPLELEGESEGVREPETGEVSPWKAREQTLELADRKLTLRIPARGDERKLVDLSLKNCKTLLEEKLNTSKANKRQAQLVDLLSQMQRELRLTKYPRHIECFDNSHIQGTAPVSSAVVFRDAKPAKRDYRTYNVRNPQGIDDFAWMEDVVYRRYAKFLDEGLELPDLIVIDGGKGQLSSAISALKRLGIETQVAVIGIAKRLEEIYYMDDPVPLYIDKKSPTLRLLQRIRNEAHNTAINFHRRKRDKQTLRTRLTEVPGIGPRTAKTLLQHFKSTERVSRATEEQLAAIIGPMKARLLVQFREQEAAETASENPD